MQAFITAILLVLASSPSFSQDIYKWEDENGVIHYGDRPSHPSAMPMSTEAIPYSHTGSLPKESATERKARLRQEKEDARYEKQQRLPDASPHLSRPKAWIDRGGRLHLSGVMHNKGRGVCTIATVEVTVFDENGGKDGSFETAISPNTLEYGGKAKFTGEYLTPVGDSLSWEAAPRCGMGELTIYGTAKRGELTISHSQTVRVRKRRNK